ncbi:MAG: circularly permuted type 2 ATP-grasp protein [Leptospira sp.]|nr:circularly permuted type 2 ATP-grasp protein [Leptospira sp.]
MNLGAYKLDGFFDEMYSSQIEARPEYKFYKRNLENLPEGEIQRRKHLVERSLLTMGITFNFYKDEVHSEAIFPFDIVPRIIGSDEWKLLEKGLKQRVFAENLFIQDIYNEKKIIKDKVIPPEVIFSSRAYLPQMEGFTPPKKIWNHINGTDLIRHTDGNYYVLEDNLRCPSGVSYVLENRENMKRTFPEMFEALNVCPVYEYPTRLLDMLHYISHTDSPRIGLLTPGAYNSAYYEHSFLANQMGIDLLVGSDMVADNGAVWIKTTNGYKQVDVLYRRIDDNFLDPLYLNPESLLGVPGLLRVYKNEKISLANAPGTGIADDKVIYAYIPKIIKYYLGEEPLIPNVPTYVCSEQKDLGYVLSNLDTLVVKAANEAGGYGMLVGPHATEKEKLEFKEKIRANPRNYIAQPTMGLSRVPTLSGNELEGRHVDLRPYIVYGKDIYVLPGGLTRVALKKGSLVVNSSQGGGSKDTWVIA